MKTSTTTDTIRRAVWTALRAIVATIADRDAANGGRDSTPIVADVRRFADALADNGGDLATFAVMDGELGLEPECGWFVRRVRNSRLFYGVLRHDRRLNGTERDEHVTPHVGEGVCYGICGDRYPYVVATVSPSGKSITLQSLRATIADDRVAKGLGVYHDHIFAPEGEPGATVYTWRAKRGCYVAKGSPMRGSAAVVVGVPDSYRDPHV